MMTMIARLTAEHGVVLLTSLATAAATVAACALALATFPLLADMPVRQVLPAVAGTAFGVALPICLTLIRTIAGIDSQKRDLAAREELLETAQKIGKLGYWQCDARTLRITLSDNMA